MSENWKIFNFESTILKDRTIEVYGYDPDKLGKSSRLPVMAICRYCGKEMSVLKGNFMRGGSACHKACIMSTMKELSPFKKAEVRQKAKEKITELYGEDRKEIGKKISKTKNTKESKQRYIDTCQEKYGVDNLFQHDEIKKKIQQSHMEKYGETSATRSPIVQDKKKKTNIERYGFTNPLQNEEIKKKCAQTNIEKYGCKSPMQNDCVQKKSQETSLKRYNTKNPIQNSEIKEKVYATNLKKYGFEHVLQNQEIMERATLAFKKSVENNENGIFDLSQTLRNNPLFWEMLETSTLKDISIFFNLDYNSLTSRLNGEEFKERYYATYSFPTMQTQKEIHDIISDKIKTQCVFSTKTIVPPLELDIYIPSHNFAIEYNGNYFHSEHMIKDIQVAKTKHAYKTQKCEEVGVRLFHIFEHQWKNRSQQIINFIRTILGKNENSIPARKCLLTHTYAGDFIEDNHIQGNTNNIYKYFNLEYNGEVIASMTASPHHRQNTEEGDIVLSRLCFKDNTNVPGGSSRLFKYFKQWAKENGYKRIISWSDNCWTQGNIYKILGFDLSCEYGPDYFYWDLKNHCHKSKQSQRKNHTGCPKGMTERDWAIENGLTRIWDCGKKKWVYEL